MRSFREWQQEKMILNMSNKQLEYEYHDTVNVRFKMFIVFSVANFILVIMGIHYMSFGNSTINLCILAGILINTIVYRHLDKRNIKYVSAILKEKKKREIRRNIIQNTRR